MQENLSKALQKVYRAVPTKSELPILSNILIKAVDNSLKLSATNLSTTIVVEVGANIEKEGVITIPARLLREFVSTLPEGSINLVLEEQVLHLISVTSKSKMNGISAADYPDLPILREDAKKFELNAKDFSDIVNKIGFCAALDESRPVFTGIYLNFDFDTLIIAASDGFRLSEMKMPLKDNKDKFSIIIPAKTLLDVTKIFSNEEPLTMIVDSSNNLVSFSQGDVFIATRLINGVYPDYERIIPQEPKYKLSFNTKELMDAVRLTNIFAKETDNAIILNVSKDGIVSLNARAQESGEHESNFPVEHNLEDSMKFGFNSKYLMDLLNNSKSQKIYMQTNGETLPCLFTSEEDEGFLHIIMPIQVNN